jgi:hypothetical protein
MTIAQTRRMVRTFMANVIVMKPRMMPTTMAKRIAKINASMTHSKHFLGYVVVASVTALILMLMELLIASMLVHLTR